MTDIELLKAAIDYLVPNAKYMVKGDSFSNITIVWNDPRPQPTKQQIVEVLPTVRELLEQQEKLDRIHEITNDMYAYIEDSCSYGLQNYLSSICIRYLHDMIRSVSSSEFETKAKLAIRVYAWIDTMYAHLQILITKIRNDVPLTENETNWSFMFDNTKPDILNIIG